MESQSVVGCSLGAGTCSRRDFTACTRRSSGQVDRSGRFRGCGAASSAASLIGAAGRDPFRPVAPREAHLREREISAMAHHHG
jgi:hypothetical protein